mgnify:CR=1 FL=1
MNAIVSLVGSQINKVVRSRERRPPGGDRRASDSSSLFIVITS